MSLRQEADIQRILDEFEKNGPKECAAALEETLREYGDGEEAEQQKILLRILIDPHLNRYPGQLRDSLVKLDYVEDPKPFDEWLYDEYYSGDLHHELWKSWQSELDKVCTLSNKVTEWYVTGCIGGGKTFASLVAQLYRGPYICSCLRCPQLFFGIAKDSEIVFGLFNAIKDNAARVDFAQLRRFVQASRWFATKCPATVTQSDCIIEWKSKTMMLKIGSSEMHALGANLFSYLIDEVNFMKTPECRDENEHQAYKIYHHTVRRMKSRFQQFGVCPGLACVVSSRASTSSFLEVLMEKNKGMPGTHVTDFSQWEAKPRNTFSEHIFRVAVGNKYRKSEVLDVVLTGGTPDTKVWRVDPTQAKEGPPGQAMLHVPVDFYFDFLRDIDGSLRDIGGVPTLAVNPLIQRTESVWECIDPKRRHPFLKEEHTLSLDDPESSLVNCVNWREIGKIVQGTWQPKHFPGLPRFAHVDLGLTGDCAAIAVGCCYDAYSLTKTDLLTGQPTEDFMPKVWVDFMIRIRPVKGEQIDLGKITTFLINLRNYGFWLQRVTFDGFASHTSIQTILKANILPLRTMMRRKAGDEVVKIDSYVLSVDKDDKAYCSLRDLLFQGAISYYHYQPFIDEVLALEHSIKKTDGGVIKGKVDHPAKGCFVGETRIPLLNGSLPTIAELEGKSVWVYSSDSNGRIVPGLAQVRKTKEVTNLVDVVLDTGAVVRCTPDHLFRLRNGSYVEASLLRPGIDRLMPLVRGVVIRDVLPVVLSTPVAVYDLSVDGWSNFALACGVFVHNSKDVSDAVCGMVWGIVTSKAYAPAHPVRDGIGDIPDNNIETQLADNLMEGVVGAHDAKIRALIPPPQVTLPARSVRGRKIATRTDWQASIPGFNRHRP
jgi:hypothetical protein